MLANKTGTTRWLARPSSIQTPRQGASHRLARTHKTVTRWRVVGRYGGLADAGKGLPLSRGYG